jgi:hypothetical protein
MMDKRKYPRVKKRVPVKLCFSDSDVITETKNISGNGALCAVTKPLNLMTKLDITMLIPKTAATDDTVKTIRCKGVVVRVERNGDESEYSHDIAIFFNDIKEPDRKKLTNYITQFVSN